MVATSADPEDSLHTLNFPVNSFIVTNFGASSASVILVILSRNSLVISDISSSLYSPFNTNSALFVEALQLNFVFHRLFSKRGAVCFSLTKMQLIPDPEKELYFFRAFNFFPFTWIILFCYFWVFRVIVYFVIVFCSGWPRPRYL
jgi:hypothetical protein